MTAASGRSDMENAVQNRRLNWLDVMKLLCILGVYCNHSSAGPHYMALFAYINGAFFFCSGYVASRHHARNFLQFARDKFVAIFWPYTTFALLTLAVRSRLTEVDLADFIKSFLYGSRSYCCSITFWFLPCLFVMTLYYYGISRAVKNKYGVLALCFALSCAVKILHEAPVLPWGIDMAARYLVYYALGDFLAHHGAALPKRARYAAAGAGCAGAEDRAGRERRHAPLDAAGSCRPAPDRLSDGGLRRFPGRCDHRRCQRHAPQRRRAGAAHTGDGCGI